MRVLLFTFAFFITTVQTSAQGIVFETGDWATIQAKAKAAGRPVFIDMYTTWCGPCKKMDKEIFPVKEVGDKFNTAFINYKLDAEKGDGVELARKFNVNSYPTYLFVTGDEVLIYRSVGSMPAEKLLSEAAIAVSEFKDPKPLAAWMDEYEDKKTDPDYLFQYLQKRKKLRLNSADVLDQYFTLTGPEKIRQSTLLPDLGLFMNLNTDGPFFQYLSTHIEEVRKAIFDQNGKNVLLKEYLVITAKNDVERAIENKDEKLLSHIRTVLLELPADDWPIQWRAAEVSMKFYSQTNQVKPLQKILDAYTRSLLQYDRAKIAVLDSALVHKYDEDVKAGKNSNTKPETIILTRQMKSLQNATSFSYRIRDAARAVSSCITDKAWLTKSLTWLDKASSYSDNFTIEEARANLLYKLGRYADAILSQQKTIDQFAEQMKRLNINNDKIRKRLDDNLQLMKDGKPLN